MLRNIDGSQETAMKQTQGLAAVAALFTAVAVG
jgi:hypothetical protein